MVLEYGWSDVCVCYHDICSLKFLRFHLCSYIKRFFINIHCIDENLLVVLNAPAATSHRAAAWKCSQDYLRLALTHETLESPMLVERYELNLFKALLHIL